MQVYHYIDEYLEIFRYIHIYITHNFVLGLARSETSTSYFGGPYVSVFVCPVQYESLAR